MAMYWPDARLMMRIDDDMTETRTEQEGGWTVIRVSPNDLEDFHTADRLLNQVKCLLDESDATSAASSMAPA